MTNSIHLGFEVGTGKKIEIPLRHLAVTGQTQESGKTTTLEGLISRSGLRAVAFITKRGESSFQTAKTIPPYFRERTDWRFVQSILEASIESKMDFKLPWIMRACEGAKTLKEVQENVRRLLYGVRDPDPRRTKRGSDDPAKERWTHKPARGMSADMYYVLDHYFDEVIPQIETLPYSADIEIEPGVNVMDLVDYEFPVQALIVRSVLEWIHKHEQKVIAVIPEAWKFAPNQRGSPVRRQAEDLIREGGALKNFIWIDSQDLAGVAHVLLRQVGVWILGVQRDIHEVKRTLQHMPIDNPKPKPSDIMTLRRGEFFVCFGDRLHKVYVQPAWCGESVAYEVAMGERTTVPRPPTRRPVISEAKNLRSSTEKEPSLGAQRDQYAKNAALEVRNDDQASKTISGDTEGAELARETVRVPGRSNAAAEGDEAMWKEKFESEERERKRLEGELAAVNKPVVELERQLDRFKDEKRPAARLEQRPVAPGVNAPSGNLEALYHAFKARLLAEPDVLAVLTKHPELQVKVEKQIIEVDGDSLRGRLARLIAKGFFDEPQNGQAAFNELKRLGAKVAKPSVYSALDKLAEMGFVTIEEKGYQAVKRMKVNVQE